MATFPAITENTCGVGEGVSKEKSVLDVKVKDFLLNRTKAIKRKLKWTNDEEMNIVLKDGDRCGIITFNTVEFERTRKFITSRYWRVNIRRPTGKSNAISVEPLFRNPSC